jgi:cation:H+ antiporter
MPIFIAAVLFTVGLIMTVGGADFFVRAARWLSDVTGISRVVIGATVIAFATSAPEFFVSLFATIKGFNDISIANVVGSVIVNIGIGFAIIAAACPSRSDKLSAFNGLIMIAVVGVALAACLVGLLTVWHALIFIAIFVFFTVVNIKSGKIHESKVQPERRKTNAAGIVLHIAFFALGLVGLIWGADVMVNNAKTLAVEFGISEYIIGLTVVAVGTSLPEIMTTIIAVIKKEHGMSVGNIVGSNIFDVAVIIAAIVFASGGTISVVRTGIAAPWFDFVVAMVFCVVTIVPTLISKRVSRWQGFVVAGLYVAYIITSIFLH